MAETDRRDDDPRLFRTIGQDLEAFLEHLGRVGLSGTVARPFNELRDFYLTTHRRDRLAGMKPLKRAFYLAFWLLKALFLKLTPPRRLLLLVSFVLLWQGDVRLSSQHVRVTVEFRLLAIAILLVILMLELKDKLLARSELEAGRAVQLALMPDHAPNFPGWDIWLYTRSANDVGGDLVDYLLVAPDRLAVSLGDVAGKGLPAALLMAKLQATLRALASPGQVLADLGASVNAILSRDGLPNRFATLVYLEVMADSGSIRLLNAGHMPPIVQGASGIHELPRGSIALGIAPQASFVEQQVHLESGDLLVAYSDGVTEAMDVAGDFFGDDRLRSAIAADAPGSAEQMGRRVLSAVDTFLGDAKPNDDLSLLVIRRLGVDSLAPTG